MAAISVIIPVYNLEAYLPRCLDSVCGQTFDDFEAIVVDDGSTDRSAALAAEYRKKDRRFRLICQKNSGQGAARNAGIDASRGEYLLFVDGDDEILPGMLEALYKAARQHGDTQLVFCDTQVVDETGRRTGSFQEDFPPGRLLSAQQRKDLLLMAPGPVSKLYQREWLIATSIRFPDGVWYEDLRTTVKLAARVDRAVYVQGEFYRYYYRSGSTMHNRDLSRNREILDAFDDLLSDYRFTERMEQFHTELEYLAVFHLYLAASVRVLREDPCSPLIAAFHSYLEKEFPQYRCNPYLSRLSRREKLVYRLLEHRQYRLLSFLFRAAGLRGGKR